MPRRGHAPDDAHGWDQQHASAHVAAHEQTRWIHEEQDRDAAERRATLAALGVPVRTMTGFGDHHVIVQVDGITVDPTSGPR